MRNEAELNLIIKKSLTWGCKIPDPTFEFSRTIARPFDGFGVLVNISANAPVYWEAKFSNHFQVFDLSRIEQHQIDNLRAIKALLPNSYCWIIYGVKVGRNDNRVWIFDDIHRINERRNERKNILKKELENFPYYPVKNQLIVLTNYILAGGKS